MKIPWARHEVRVGAGLCSWQFREAEWRTAAFLVKFTPALYLSKRSCRLKRRDNALLFKHLRKRVVKWRQLIQRKEQNFTQFIKRASFQNEHWSRSWILIIGRCDTIYCWNLLKYNLDSFSFHEQSCFRSCAKKTKKSAVGEELKIRQTSNFSTFCLKIKQWNQLDFNLRHRASIKRKFSRNPNCLLNYLSTRDLYLPWAFSEFSWKIFIYLRKVHTFSKVMIVNPSTSKRK